MSGHSPSSDDTASAEAAVASAPPVLRLEAVSRTYGSGPAAVEALKDIDLEFQCGEFVVILGPSGSGKTTLLNLIGGIEAPTDGRILLSGNDIQPGGDSDGAGERGDHCRTRRRTLCSAQS